MKLERAAQWAEIFANFGVILSLLFLVFEVRENTQILRIQAAEERTTALNAPILSNSGLAEILAKIKTVDGVEPHVEAFMERYELTYAESTIWTRYLGDLWSGMDVEFVQLGPSEQLAHRIRQLLAFPDETLWLDSGSADWFMSDNFRAYVASIRASM